MCCKCTSVIIGSEVSVQKEPILFYDHLIGFLPVWKLNSVPSGENQEEQ